MALTSIPTRSDGRTRTIRFTTGVCHDGIDYGPKHVDVPVTLPWHVATAYIAQGRAVDARPARPPRALSGEDAGAGASGKSAVTSPRTDTGPAPRGRGKQRR